MPDALWNSKCLRAPWSEYVLSFEKGPELNLTAEEKHVYRQLFLAADEENKGVITGQNAVKFFGKSGLEPSVLSQVCVD